MALPKFHKDRVNQGWQLAVQKAGSQSKLADALGITQGLVSQYANGRKQCKPPLAVRLEELLGVPKWMTLPEVFSKPEGA